MIPTRLRPNLRSVFGQAGFTVADQALVSLVNFSSFLLLARAMSGADLGLFSLGFTTLLILTSFQQALLGNVFQVKAAPREGSALKTFATVVFTAQFALSALSIGVILILAGVLALIGRAESAEFMAALALATGPWMTQDLMRKAFYTRKRIASAFLNDLICYGLQMAGVIWLLMGLSTPTATHGLMAYGAASALAALVGFYQLRDLFSLRVLRVRRQVRVVLAEIWSYGKWLSGARLAKEFGSSGHTWIVAAIMGPAALGAFRAVTHLVNVFNPVELAVGLWIPSAASRKFDAEGGAGLKKWYDSLVPVLLIPMAVGAVILTLTSEYLIHIAYSGKYDHMGLHWIVALLGFNRVISFGRDLYHNGLVAANRPDTSVPDSLISAGLKYGVGIPSVYLWGLLGAPASGVVSSLGTLIYNRWAFLALPDQAIRPPRKSNWHPIGEGMEARVFHDVTPGVITKIYAEQASPELAWNYYAALEAAAARPDYNVVATPRPIGFEPEIPLIRMESCRGIALGDWVRGPSYDRLLARDLAGRIWQGMNSVVAATGTPTFDLWPNNTLYDPDSDQVTFIDFARGSEMVSKNLGSLGAQSLGGFIGHAFYNLSRPGSLLHFGHQNRVRGLCRDLWDLVETLEDRAAVRQVAWDIYRDCTRSGGVLRRAYYRSLGGLVHSLHARLTFGSDYSLPLQGHETTMIYHYFSDFPEDHVRTANGVRKAVRSLAAGLAGIGVRSHILTEGPVRSSWMTAGSVDVHCFRSRAPRFQGVMLPSGLRDFVRALPPDALFVVHGQFSRRASRVAIMLRRQGRPYVLMPHSLYSQDVFDRNAAQKLLYWHLVEKRVLKHAALIQLMEDSQATPLRERGITTPVAVVPNAFDPDFRLPVEALSWEQGGPIRLYYLGRINFHQKGLDLLVRAVAQVMDEYSITLTIQGPDGGALEELKQIMKETGADAVTTVLPPDYNTSATELMAAYDAYCMPSRIEGFPIAAIEAMQAARPLLFSNVSGLTRAIEESGCGVLVRPELQDVVRGLRQLCSRRPEFRSMGLAGLDYLERHYSRRAVAEQALEAYQGILQGMVQANGQAKHQANRQGSTALSDAQGQDSPSLEAGLRQGRPPQRSTGDDRLRKAGSEPMNQR